MTFRCSNLIRQGGQLSPLLYNVYTDDLNHHLQAKGVGCYVGGACVNSLSYNQILIHFIETRFQNTIGILIKIQMAWLTDWQVIW